MTENPALLQRLFARPTLGEVDDALLTGMIRDYPYFAHARWLRAAKMASGPERIGALHQASAFAFHPLRLESFMAIRRNGDSLPGDAGEPAQPLSGPAREAPAPSVGAIPQSEPNGKSEAENTPHNLIQPLFTEDYFAYTGAKLPEHLQNDKKPTMEQLHSFTDWLRTMKRPKGSADPDLDPNQAPDPEPSAEERELATVTRSADASLRTDSEVFTEAMAEVRINAGQTEKAVAIYEKLSLHYPEKSSYFAQKIADLKSK